jgi:hypothetical protein
LGLALDKLLGALFFRQVHALVWAGNPVSNKKVLCIGGRIAENRHLARTKI